MPATKKVTEKPVDLEKLQSIAVTGKKKTYYMDHHVIWDPNTSKALVVADKDDDGRAFVTTSSTDLQEKLEARGYIADQRTKLMHTSMKNPGTISKSEARKRAEK